MTVARLRYASPESRLTELERQYLEAAAAKSKSYFECSLFLCYALQVSNMCGFFHQQNL
jgi:hypothetical protein